LGVTQKDIEDAVAESRPFAFVGPDGERYYPAFYAVADMDRASLEPVAQELLDLPAPSKYHFFVSKRTNLGETPLEALKRGRVAEVLRAASDFAIT
jgi:hypothetical protein